MGAFILRRIFIAIPVLVIVVSLVFLFMRFTPGSPFSTDRAIPQSILEKLEAQYKLDGTLWEQYRSYLADVFLRGDLRDSTKYKSRSVNEILAQTAPVSMLLGGVAFLIVLSIGIPLGTLAAVFHNRIWDRLAMLVALLGISLPAFIIAPLLVLLLCIKHPIFPVAGWGTLGHILLPAFCLALPFAASVSRLMRGSVLEVLGQDFVRTARAKGLGEIKIVAKHVLRVAILPIVSYSGPLTANLLTGSMVIEYIFKIPGMGSFFVNGVLNRDIFLVGGVVLFYSALLISFNLIVDVLYGVLDRRIQVA